MPAIIMGKAVMGLKPLGYSFNRDESVFLRLFFYMSILKFKVIIKFN